MNSEIRLLENGEGSDAFLSEGIFGGKDLAAIAIYLSRRTAVDLDLLLGELERQIIIETLKSTRGNQWEASQKLGVKYTTFNEKVKRHRIAFRKWIAVDYA